ncbi:MAG: OsmC family protein [Anaerolineaceae bacterium]
MEAKVTWKGVLGFDGSADTGFSVPLDGAPEVGGAGAGFLPMELIATGLAGCTAMDVISILRKKQQDVTAFEVKVHAQRADAHPKVFTHIILEYLVTGRNVDPAAVERAIELSETKYCPAQSMLSKAVAIEHQYQIFNAD